MKRSTGILLLFLGTVGGLLIGGKSHNNVRKKSGQSNKFVNYFYILNNWLTLKEKGKDTSGYFADNGFNSIAIYGMGHLGRHLYEDLKKTGINVAYAIDRDINQAYADVKLMALEEELPEVDAIIVTPTFDFEVIEKALQEKTDCPVISLEEVIAASM